MAEHSGSNGREAVPHPLRLSPSILRSGVEAIGQHGSVDRSVRLNPSRKRGTLGNTPNLIPCQPAWTIESPLRRGWLRDLPP